MLSVTEAQYVHAGLVGDVRTDGRRRVDHRNVVLRCGTARHADGSATATCDGTVVTVSIGHTVCEASEAAPPVRFMVDVGPSVVNGQAAASRLQYLLARLYGIPTDADAAAAVDTATQICRHTPLLRAPMSELEAVADVCVATEAERAVLGVGGYSACPISGAVLAIGEGAQHRFALLADVSVLGDAGGNVEGLAALAVKAAIASTRLPAASVSVGDDGVAGVAVDVSQRGQPLGDHGLGVVVALRSGAGVYAVDPACEEAGALPGKAWIGVDPAGIVVATLTEGRLPLADITAMLHDASSAACVLHDAVRKATTGDI